MKNALGSKGIFMFLLLAYSSSGNSDVVYKGEAIFGTAKQYADRKYVLLSNNGDSSSYGLRLGAYFTTYLGLDLTYFDYGTVKNNYPAISSPINDGSNGRAESLGGAITNRLISTAGL